MRKAKIKLRGHESFYIREGWLTKALVAISENKEILSDVSLAVDTLGVGSAMVKSIRYWLQAIGLTKEKHGLKGKRYQVLTEEFGEKLFKEDKYFEDLGTLYLLHYKLASNLELATTWYLFFNDIKANEMTKEHMESTLNQLILNIDPEYDVSLRSLRDDCNCIIKSYFSEDGDLENPEDNMVCPFAELGLIKKSKVRGGDEVIYKTIPSKNKLNRLIVLYVILDNLGEKSSTTIKNLIEDKCNIGAVFNLDKNSINYYVDLLVEEGYLNINRTAGLNAIYLTDLIKNKEEVLKTYYSEAKECS